MFVFQAEDGIRDSSGTGVQTCAVLISSRRRHTRFKCDWSSDVCSSDLVPENGGDSERYYAFTYGSSRFLILDSNAYSFALTDQTSWIERELISARQDPAIHHVFVDRKSTRLNSSHT